MVITVLDSIFLCAKCEYHTSRIEHQTPGTKVNVIHIIFAQFNGAE